MSQSIGRRALTKLADPLLGVSFAWSEGVLCAAGAVLLKLNPNFYRYRLWPGLEALRWHSLWVLVLFGVATLWCGHALLELRGAFKRRGGPRRSGRIGLWQALVQLGAVVALWAYLWRVVGAPPEEFLVTPQGADIHGESYRALRVQLGEPESKPPRGAVAWLERRVGAESEQMRLERGHFWPSRTAGYQLVVARATLSTVGAIMRVGGRRVELMTDKPTRRGPVKLLLQGLRYLRRDRSQRVPQAELKVDGKQKVIPLDPEWAGEQAFLGLKEAPVVLLRVYRNHSLSLGATAVALLLLGAALARTQRDGVRGTQP